MLSVENFQQDFFKNLPQQSQVTNPDRHYLLAYSGGCDSRVLLQLLFDLKQAGKIKNLQALHINHQLHQDSNQWAEHCVKQCERLNIPCEVVKVTVNTSAGQGIEAAARTARYQAIAERVTENTTVLTAQHADDQVETFLLQSLRGSGVKGLAAMPVIKRFENGYLYRPLLSVTQGDIQSYAKAHNLNWVEDPSNEHTHIDRNFLRHNVVPLLKQRWPASHKTFARVVQHQAEAAQLVDELAQIDWLTLQLENNTLSLNKLKLLSYVRQKNVLRYWLHNIQGLSLPDNVHLSRILQELVPAADDAQPEVRWGDVIVRRFNGMLYADSMQNNFITTRFSWSADKTFALSHTVNGSQKKLQLLTRQVTGQGLSKQKLDNNTVTVRFRQGGEVCTPDGRGNHQHKLKKLFQEWQVPPWQRGHVPLIYVGDELAQVVGYCLCAPFVADKTEQGYLISLDSN